MRIAFLNGKFVPLKNARVSILDRGFLYGDGVFETMRSYDERVFQLERHIDRLLTSLKILRIKIPYTKNKLSSLINKALRLNKLNNAYIKLLVTRGVAPGGIDIPKTAKPTLLIYASPLRGIPESIYKKGIGINFACVDKNEKSFIARIKSLNYLDNILARAEVRDAGFDEAVFINAKGNVAEATTSNIFMVKKDVVITPPPTAGLLPGITRQVVIEIIKKYFRSKIYERNIRPGYLLNADEIFLTNSILEIVPVVKLGKERIGKGRPGAFSRIIRTLYKTEAKNV